MCYMVYFEGTTKARNQIFHNNPSFIISSHFTDDYNLYFYEYFLIDIYKITYFYSFTKII